MYCQSLMSQLKTILSAPLSQTKLSSQYLMKDLINYAKCGNLNQKLLLFSKLLILQVWSEVPHKDKVWVTISWATSNKLMAFITLLEPSKTKTSLTLKTQLTQSETCKSLTPNLFLKILNMLTTELMILTNKLKEPIIKKPDNKSIFLKELKNFLTRIFG